MCWPYTSVRSDQGWQKQRVTCDYSDAFVTILHRCWELAVAQGRWESGPRFSWALELVWAPGKCWKKEQETDGRWDLLKCHNFLRLFSPVSHLRKAGWHRANGVLTQMCKKRARMERDRVNFQVTKSTQETFFYPSVAVKKIKTKKFFKPAFISESESVSSALASSSTRRRRGRGRSSPACAIALASRQGHRWKRRVPLQATNPTVPPSACAHSELYSFSGDPEGCVKHCRGGGGRRWHPTRAAGGDGGAEVTGKWLPGLCSERRHTAAVFT